MFGNVNAKNWTQTIADLHILSYVVIIPPFFLFRIHEKYEISQQEIQKILLQKKLESEQKLPAEYMY